MDKLLRDMTDEELRQEAEKYAQEITLVGDHFRVKHRGEILTLMNRDALEGWVHRTRVAKALWPDQ